MNYSRPNGMIYRVAQGISWLVAKVLFCRQYMRNEIRDLQGPFVVIANHQSKLDFVNVIGACKRPMSFVISKSFYSTLPIGGILRKMGVIPKQQFQTAVSDMKRMKAVVDHGQPLVIYPAGLMCEDGLSTPIPRATYKFLRWLGVDVYVARCYGTYFAMPKWAKNVRPGKTCLDIYKLFSAQELQELPLEEIRQRAEDALLFDAYREQEQLQIPYSDNIEGLENVLYVCPNCHREFTMQVRDGNTICCSCCGYAQTSDKMGFLHNQSGIGPELRYVSDWSRQIYRDMKQQLKAEPELRLECTAQIHMVNPQKRKFESVGSGVISLHKGQFLFAGTIHGELVQMHLPAASLPTLPFTPGKYFEIQQGENIYRCVLEDGKLVMKFINMVKIFHELSLTAV